MGIDSIEAAAGTASMERIVADQHFSGCPWRDSNSFIDRMRLGTFCEPPVFQASLIISQQHDYLVTNQLKSNRSHIEAAHTSYEGAADSSDDGVGSASAGISG